jgi:DnaT-like ssDNA binding protein
MTLLVPERMLVFSPALAATIGLEEAVLLHLLHDLSVAQVRPAQAPWFVVEREALEQLLPFWERRELQRISKNLADQGVIDIDSAPLTEAAQLHFRFRLGTQTATRAAAPLSPPTPISNTRGASLLGTHWRPQEDTLQLLALKNIPRQFALEQLEEFVFYWRERGKAEYAWDNKFRKHVIERWQRELQNSAANQALTQAPTVAPDSIWYPSIDALQILERTGISREFIEDTIPEFVLYWRERGDNTGTWNSKFVAHIRRQWARYSNALEHDQEPRPIAANWQPSEDVYDILRMANIDIQFACELLPEFILFWRDAGTPQRSWNTKFLQHIKYQWATRHHLTSVAGVQRAGYSLATGAAAAVAPSNAFERLTDRSWASGLVEGV